MFGAITFDFGPRSRGQNAIFANILKTRRDKDFVSIVDIEENNYGLSFGAMTFDLGPRPRGQNAILANISKTAKDRDFISILDI